MNNDERDEALYRYPGSSVLRNKFDIRDGATLARQERLHVAQRIREGLPGGNFDLKHLCAIHRHLFQDVYEWAGKPRQTIISKGESKFLHPDLVTPGMADLHKRLSAQNYLRDLRADKFSTQAAEYVGDINRLHPFREGNGRTQFQYLKLLGAQAGHDVDLSKFERASWIQASIEANQFRTEGMAACISAALTKPGQNQVSSDRLNRLRERYRAKSGGEGTSDKGDKQGNGQKQ